jgi:hypothetical protein
VRHPRGLLHANFVVAVLSDLFGIQARSGCFCAGPYLHRLHPIDEAWSAAMHAQTREGQLGAKLAFARVSFDYHLSPAVFDYIVEAVHLLAADGWRLLPLYRFDPGSGRWDHAEGRPRTAVVGSASERALARQLDDARRILRGLANAPRTAPPAPPLSAEFERIRWFPLPGEA